MNQQIVLSGDDWQFKGFYGEDWRWRGQPKNAQSELQNSPKSLILCEKRGQMIAQLRLCSK